MVGAAEVLGFTPSAISQQIKRLEAQIRVPLLERVGRGVVLTTQGRELVEEGMAVLGHLERVEAELHRSTGVVAGHFRIAAFSTAMRGIVAGVARRLLDEQPDLSLALLEREPWDAVDLVASGQCDIGVIHQWGDVPVDVPDHLARVAVADDVADVIAHRSHRLAGRDSVRPADLIDERWIATPPDSICRQWLGRMYEGTGRRPRIAHESAEFDSHLALVQADLGIALIPRLGRSPLPADVVAVRVSDPVPARTVLAIHRRTLAQSPAVAAIVAALAEYGRPTKSSARRP